jgi:uncharacterized repeat protein (TIGR01451 family)
MTRAHQRRIFAAAIIVIALATAAHAQSADVGVIKTGPDFATANSDVTYTITVQSNGPDDALSATLTDNIPSGMTFVSDLQNSGPAFVCTDPGAGLGGTVSCSIPTFPAGTSAAFTFVFHIPAGTPDGTLFLNVATVTNELPDPTDENNTSVYGTSTPPTPQADVSITKSAAPGAAAGMDVPFTIVLSNPSSNAAGSVTWHDALPGTMTFVSLSPNSGCTMPAPGSNGAIDCDIGTMAANSSITYTLVANIPPATVAGTTFTNIATVASSNDPSPENDSSAATVTVGSVDLSVIKSGPPAVVAGNPLIYTITMANAGPDAATNVNLTDAIPAGTRFISFVQNTGAPGTCSTPIVGGTGTVGCEFGFMNAGASASFTLTLDARNSVSVTNTASVTSDSFETNPGDNSSTATTSITQNADIAVTKTAPAVSTAGQTLTYAITVTNNGASDATAVSLTDVIPSNTTFASFTAPAGWATTMPAPGTTGTVTAMTSTLTAGASAAFTLVVNVDPLAPVGSSIANTATSASGTPDANAANNGATAITTVAAAISDLAIQKTMAAIVLINTNTAFTIVVTNNGPNAASAVTMTDALPPSLSFVSATPTQGTCSGTTTVTCSLGTLTANTSAIITIVAKAIAVGPSANTATVSSASADPNPANNTATANFVVVAQIPTLSPLLLALLAVLLGALAVRLLTE